MKTRFRVMLLVAIALTIGFTPSAQAVEPIKLVHCEILSGNFQDVGERSVKGVEYAVKEINARGGILGRPVKHFVFDHEGKLDVTTRKATRYLLDEKVHYFTGGTFSSIANAMSNFAKKNKILLFAYMWPPQNLTNENCHRYFFRPSVSTDMQSNAIAYWVKSKGFKRVFCIGQDWNFGHESTGAFIRKLAEIAPDIKIVGEIYHKPAEKEFAPYISQALAAKADVIFTGDWGNDLRLLIKQSISLGLKVPYATYVLGDVENFKAIGRDIGEQIIGSCACDGFELTIPTEANKKFVEGFHKAYGFYPSYTEGKAYDNVLFWAKAVQTAGKDDVEAVIDAWEGLEYEGIGGKVKMRPCDHQGIRSVWCAEVSKRNPYFDFPYMGDAVEFPGEKVVTPADKTNCPRCMKK
ncbi:MAG: ABC transporter substrate-binding protein [Deltaproteobacteria bacterium]|nr:ABC transporter substrate-binding protein [Deltaproteobacteria bacterium]